MEKTNWGPVIVDIVIVVAAAMTRTWALLWLLIFTGGDFLPGEADRGRVMAHTKWPWEVSKGKKDTVESPGQDVGEIIVANGVHIVCFGHDYDEGGSICATWPDTDGRMLLSSEREQYYAEAESNARLMAAAPDLLLACQVALHDRMYKDWPEVADILMAAIKKADPDA